MGEINENINNKTSNLIARNIPVALVVGVAGFLGSNLADKLLEKRIQVIGVDNFSSGKKEHLREAIRNKHFHLISSSAENFELDIERLDYIFITTNDGWKVGSVLSLAEKFNSKIVFISTIDLYDTHSDVPAWFKETEGIIAKFASDKKLNTRIIRLAALFGPRMHFKNNDPLTRLIQASLSGDLQKESVALDFSSRALYIEDAVNLIIKSVFSGSTAQKIFDGCLLHPIKATEIKQVLLDPLWYQHRGFTPTQLPPWPTPNLEKTINILSWKPKIDLVLSLKETLSYFRDNEISVPKEAERVVKVEKEKIIPWIEVEPKNKQIKNLTKPKTKWGRVYVIICLLIILYAFVYPILMMGWGVVNFKNKLEQASIHLSKGEFEKSRDAVREARLGVNQAKIFIGSFEGLKKGGFLKEQFEGADKLIEVTDLITTSADHSVTGTKNLYDSLKIITGESTGSAKELLVSAQVEFNQAYEESFRVQAELQREEFKDILPQIIKPRIDNLISHVATYNNLLQKGYSISAFLPQLVAVDGKKSYLIVLQNNNELRPTGGFIGSFGRVDFENGKLQKIDVNDIYAIDGALSLHVEPPKEIKEDLNQKDWFLRDSNWEPDFPTSARQIQWFYNKETGNKVDGVIAMDISAIEDLLSIVGPLEVLDYGEKITSDNLFERVVTHAETGFFPGSQAKKNFLTALTNELFNKLFFIPNQNWPGIVLSLGKSLENKHMISYFGDTKLFSYMVSQNWAGVLPREDKQQKGLLTDFLFPVEANLGANKSNYYLERIYNLETTIGKEGEVFQRLKIDYTNRSPSDTFPAGKYKNRMRLYLPFGTKLNRLLWGDSDITSKVTPFADYGRSGYSYLLELEPKEHKTLVVDYQLQSKIEFKDNQAKYRIDVIKQPGTLKDRFDWKLTFPINYRLSSGDGEQIGKQEYKISSDLSKDRSFEVTFKQ